MGDRRQPLSSIGLVAILAVACSAPLAPVGDDFVLPREIQGLALTDEQTGERAAGQIGRMHGREVAPEGSVIATFGTSPDEIVVYVSRFATEQEAAEQVRRMADAIGPGRSGFGHHETTPRDGRTIHTVLGYGQKHYFFSTGDRVIWLSAPPPVAAAALDELLEAEPGT